MGDAGRVKLWHGDCLALLPGVPDASLDACVTDPPYEYGFMGQTWDRSGIAYNVALWQEVLRVLKPGGHVLAFGGSRTYHRLACAIEDAGFEIRDQLNWVYGSGYPKSKNLGDGRGTALKPGHEPIVLARKPLIGTVTANAQAYGTGVLHIDACRVGYAGLADAAQSARPGHEGKTSTANIFNPIPKMHAEQHIAGRWPPNLLLSHSVDCEPVGTRRVKGTHRPGPQGFTTQYIPINAVAEGGNHPTTYTDADGYETVDAWECAPDCPVAELDRQSGERAVSGAARSGVPALADNQGMFSRGTLTGNGTLHNDTGGASRFYPTFRYQAKASRAERNRGCEGLPEQPVTEADKWAVRSRRSGTAKNLTEWQATPTANHHPTVKPVALLLWLCRLITPPGGVILDPFVGSGSTGLAAIQGGYGLIGMEERADYYAIACARIAAAQAAYQPTLLDVPA